MRRRGRFNTSSPGSQQEVPVVESVHAVAAGLKEKIFIMSVLKFHKTFVEHIILTHSASLTSMSLSVALMLAVANAVMGH